MTCAASRSRAAAKALVATTHGRSSSNMRASSSPTRRSTTSAERSMCTRISAAAASARPAADGVEDLQVLLDRRLDPVRRREVVDPDHADALVDVAQVALGRAVARRVRDAPRGTPRRRSTKSGAVVVLGAQLQPLVVQRRRAARGRRCAPRGPRARCARRRARASPTRAARSGRTPPERSRTTWPSPSSRRSASRTGVRLVLKRSASCSSTSRWP